MVIYIVFMGKIRAINESEKIEKRNNILRIAGMLLLKMSYRDITVNRIAEASGLAKGTIFLYFETKEDIFLSLAGQLIDTWGGKLRKALQSYSTGKNGTGAEEFVDVIISTLDDVLLVKLFAILDDTLEQNIEKKRAMKFKVFLRDIMTGCGDIIEDLFPEMKKGDGAIVLNGLFVNLVGAYKVSNQSETIRKIADQPGMEIFRRDFNSILRHTSVCYITGFLSLRRGE